MPAEASVSARYQGGSLGLKDDEKVTISIKDGRIGMRARTAAFSVQANTVTKITYGQNTRSRLAEGIGVGVLNPTAGCVLGRSKSTAHFVEVLWEGSAPGGAVFRVDKDDYRGLLAALEASTGVQVHMEPTPPSRDWQ